MDVKPGYKLTEVGVIPDEWVVLPFAQVVEKYIDYRGRTPKKLGLSWGGGDILALSANNVQMGRIDPEKDAYYGSDELYRKWMVQGECEHGDILLTMEAPLGNVAQIPDSKKYILSQRVLLIKPKAWLLRKFFAHYMRGSFFQRQLDFNSTGSTAKGIQRRKLDDLLIGLPSRKAEQRAIAEALSDTDALIESLEQIVAKKRQIKQGAMQELLTEKRRLPGYKGDWESAELKRLVQTPITDGPHLTPRFLDNGVPFLSVNNLIDNRIDLSDLRYISKADDQIFAKKCKPRKNDVLLGKAASVGKVAIVEDDFDFNIWSPIALVRAGNQIDAKFLYYQLQGSDCVRQIALLTNSSSQGNIGMGDIEILRISFPSIDEQTAIASVLSDLDTEIAALEKKLAKARQLKQGMMQELLTGRIRLV